MESGKIQRVIFIQMILNMMIYKISLRKIFGDALKETKIRSAIYPQTLEIYMKIKVLLKMSHFGNISFQFIIHLLIVIVKVQFLNHTTNIKSHINAKKEKFKPSKVRRALKLEVRILLEFLLQDDEWPCRLYLFFKQKYQQLLEKRQKIVSLLFLRTWNNQ